MSAADDPLTVPEATFAQAFALHEQGELDQAEALYRAVLSADGTHAGTLVQLGVLRLQQGLHAAALDFTRAALALDPDNAEAYGNLGAALHSLSRHVEAIEAFETALSLDPDRAESHYGLAVVLHALCRHDEAIGCYDRALIIDPEYAEAACGLGSALSMTGRHERAIGYYQRALDVDSDYTEAICGIAEAQQSLNRHDEAISGFRRAIALQPGVAQAHLGLGVTLQQMERHREAEASIRAAVALAPGHADAYRQLGSVLNELGRNEEASRVLETAVSLDPRNIGTLFTLVSLRRVQADDPALAALEAIAQQPAHGRGSEDQIRLHFALGKALSDVAREAEGFQHLLAGNALKRQELEYEEASALALMQRMRPVFTSRFIRRRSGIGDRSSLPIFIVGMPRSGTTLLEQILASHPDVFGAGERSDFVVTMQSHGIDSTQSSFPELVTDLTDAQLQRLGADYVDRLRATAKNAGAGVVLRITDKMLANFCVAGLIHLALPGARIIQMRRDPVDTCLSCFSKLFANGQPFAYDLGELGRYQRACTTLMDHWRLVLPSDVVLDVCYEQLVADFESQVGRVLAHCGLAWNPACLAFHKTDRVIRTASVSQVREPLFRTSVNRWRPSPDLLQPLLDAIAT